MTYTYTELKTQQRADRDSYHINLGLRVHRALSWLNRSEQCEEDLDSHFIFLWIAFNSAYSSDISMTGNISEQSRFKNYFERLCQLDKEQKIYHLFWSEFSGSIRLILDNKYVFQPFWDYYNSLDESIDWKEQFKKAKNEANKALGNKNTSVMLSIVFSRLYTLRNQMIHGGATWNSQVNRDQIRDAVNLMKKLIPLFIKVMMDHPEALWGDPCYPVVED